MTDGTVQGGGVSITLLLTSLFVTAFGIGGQISSTIAANEPITNGTQAVVANAIRSEKGTVLSKHIDFGQGEIPDAMATSASASAFLSEVTDTATPSASPLPKVSQTRLVPSLTSKPKATLRSLTMDKSHSSPTPSSSPSPQSTVAPIKVTASPKQLPTVTTPTGSLSGDVIFDLVNKHRVTIGKPALQKDERICAIVKARAPQVKDELYGGKKMHSGFYALKLPYWATENIAAYGSESQAVNWWLSDAIHRKAIESTATHSCAACSGRYCSQVFTSFVKK